MKTREEEMREQTIEYHKKYPKVWELFCKFALEKIGQGFKNYSCSAIFERIRWETDTPDVKDENRFKLGNNYRAFYSRAFAKTHPQYKDFFRTREQLSKNKPATNKPELTPSDFALVNK